MLEWPLQDDVRRARVDHFSTKDVPFKPLELVQRVEKAIETDPLLKPYFAQLYQRFRA
jgi:hypothetical protein